MLPAGLSWLWTTAETWDVVQFTFQIGPPRKTTMVSDATGGHVGVCGSCCYPRLWRRSTSKWMFTVCATDWSHVDIMDLAATKGYVWVQGPTAARVCVDVHGPGCLQWPCLGLWPHCSWGPYSWSVLLPEILRKSTICAPGNRALRRSWNCGCEAGNPFFFVSFPSFRSLPSLRSECTEEPAQTRTVSLIVASVSVSPYESWAVDFVGCVFLLPWPL